MKKLAIIAFSLVLTVLTMTGCRRNVPQGTTIPTTAAPTTRATTAPTMPSTASTVPSTAHTVPSTTATVPDGTTGTHGTEGMETVPNAARGAVRG